jgi:pyrimidine-specific ribonucleoside hydrolase
MKTNLAHLLILMALLFPAFAFANPSLMVDTDMNTDDAIALLYLLQNQHVNIKAITVEANSSVHCYPALKNIAGLIALTKHTAVPTACGNEKNVKDNHQFPAKLWHETDTLSGTAGLLPQKNIKPNHHAVILLQQTLLKAKEPVDILMLGAHTNLAQLLAKNPLIKNKIHRIYVMGGAIHVPGNLNTIEVSNNHLAEWNIYFDPSAAMMVFHSGVPIYLVPLDLTNRFPLDVQFFSKLKPWRGTPVVDYFYEIMSKNFQMLTSGKWYFWDPLAAVIAVHPEFAVFQQEKISVLQFPEQKSGATVMDKAQGDLIHVGKFVDKRRFENELISQIAKRHLTTYP